MIYYMVNVSYDLLYGECLFNYPQKRNYFSSLSWIITATPCLFCWSGFVVFFEKFKIPGVYVYYYFKADNCQ